MVARKKLKKTKSFKHSHRALSNVLEPAKGRGLEKAKVDKAMTQSQSWEGNEIEGKSRRPNQARRNFIIQPRNVSKAWNSLQKKRGSDTRDSAEAQGTEGSPLPSQAMDEPPTAPDAARTQNDS